MKKAFPDLTVGILGGGQLARMLALRAHQLGVEVAIFSQNKTDPAAKVAGNWFRGDPGSANDLRSFLKTVNVVTFESEFQDALLLKQLSRETKVPIFPQPSLMHQIQDRLTQKKLLDKTGLPTAPWLPVSGFADAEKALHEFGGTMVLKKRRFGYDGYGTYMVRKPSDLTGLRETIENERHGFIAEALIPFTSELAVIIARRKSGETISLPFVQTYQENSRCLWVKGPVKSRPTETLRKKLQRFLDDLKYVGVMGIELFASADGILVNELAPRVHNSGHYSMNALSEDQFTLHIKSILDMPFSVVQPLQPAFAMVNILGRSDKQMKWELPPNVHLHWYGKEENRPGRKMGHLNALGKTPEQALKLAQNARSRFQV